MERRRPNRELKNSEDVQDALIEDYFRYNDLLRMEGPGKSTVRYIHVLSQESQRSDTYMY